MPTFTLKANKKPAVSFTGEIIGEATSKRSNSYRWTDMTGYKTQGGKFICHIVGTSTEGGEQFQKWSEVHVYDTEQEMIKDRGVNRLTNSLYNQMGFTIEVE